MAAAAAEPLLHNLSTTTIRAPYSSSAAPSMADSLTPLDFGFDDLRACMNTFTKRFDDFIEKGRRRVLDERNQFRMNVAEVQDEQSQKQRSIAALDQKTYQHSATLSAQSAETAEMNAAISQLTSTRDTHAAAAAALRAKLTTARSTINTRKAAQRQHQQYMSHQAGFNGPELEFWEGYLGLRIEGTGVADRVRFVFRGCEERKVERECWFELDMSGGGGKGYEVVGSRPKLDEGTVEKCLERMREREDLVGFLKGMRELFIEELR